MGGSPSFWQFSAGNFDQKLLKNLLYMPHSEAAAFQEWNPPFLQASSSARQARQVLGDDYKVFIVEEMDDLVLTV